jgi:hypothetical protein
MKPIKINLNCFINNWPQEFEHSDENSFAGSIKRVNSFIVNVEDTDTIEMLQKRVSSYLFKLLHDDEKNWKNAGRCMYCFNDTVELNPEDPTMIMCDTCDRLYTHIPTYKSIPLPSIKYVCLYTLDNGPLIYTNDYDMNSPIEFVTNDFDYRTIDPEPFNDLRGKWIDDGPPQIINNGSLKIPLGITEYEMIYFPDMFLYLEQVNLNGTIIKKNLSRMFWDVDYNNYSKKVENSVQNDPVEPNFIKDNESLNTLNTDITLSTDTITEFNKIIGSNLKNMKKGFTKVFIKVFQDDTVPFINLLRIFHLLDVSEEIPFMSLFVDRINQKRYKILRSLSTDLYQDWIDQNSKTKQLLFKIKIRGSYFTLILTSTNMMKIILPMSSKLNIQQELFEEMSLNVNNVIQKIKKLSYHEKRYPQENIKTMSEDVLKWGSDDFTEFSALSMNVSFQANDIDMIHLGTIIECLRPYALINKIENSEVSFLYIHNVVSKQGIRYDKYLWNLIKFKIRTYKPLDFEDIKIQFGQEFDLEGTQLDIIFSQWTGQNKIIIDKIRENPSFAYTFKPILDGVAIKIERTEDFFNVNIQGIKYWHQEDDILLFIKRLFSLESNISTNKFFSNNCKGISKKQLTDKRGTNLKIALKRFLPDIFWDSGNDKNNPGFTRKCQKKEQPKIFSDEQSYLDWMKTQMPTGLTETQKIFTRDCPTLTSKEIDILLLDLGIPVSGNTRAEKCILYQQAIFKESNFSPKELKEILISLLLPVPSNTLKRVETVNRYFNIQSFLGQEDVDNVYPNPQTFIINRNNQNYYLTCPNGLDNVKSRGSTYMGFLDIDANPSAKKAIGNEKRKFCVPCCKQKINEARVDFCSAVIDYDELQSGKTSSAEYIKNDKKFPLIVDRYGHLPGLIHELLNVNDNKILEKSIRLGLIKPKKPLFLRKGIVQNNFSFLQAVLSVLPETLSIETALRIIESKLTEKIFRSLNSGNIYWEYNASLAQFKNIMNITNMEEIDIQHLWELVSMPGILTVNGINIMIFDIRERLVGIKSIDELHLICPQNQEIDHFYQVRRPTIMMYHNNNQYEPIEMYVSAGKQIGMFDFTGQDTFKAIQDWYSDACDVLELDKKSTAKSLISRFYGKIKVQLIDSFNKVQYLVTNNGMMIPTIPSGLDVNTPVKKLNKENIVLNSYDNTMKFLKQNKFVVSKLIVKDTLITHIIMDNGRFLPIEPSTLSETNEMSIAEPSSLIDYTNIDNAILDDIDKELFTEIKKGNYFKESYEMFRYHFANSLVELEQEQLRNKYPVEELLVNKFIKTIGITNSVNVDEYITPNIRKLCDTSNCMDSVHCVKDADHCKFVILEENLTIYTKRLINELQRFKLKRKEIIDNTIEPIIDLTKFVPTNLYFFK